MKIVKRLYQKTIQDIRFIYKYMLKKEPHNLTKNQMISIILRPLDFKHYAMDIEMTEFKNFHLQCATCGGLYYDYTYVPPKKVIIKLSEIKKELLHKIWNYNANHNEGKGYIDLEKDLGINNMYCKQNIIDSNGHKHICGGTLIQLINSNSGNRFPSK